MSTSYGSVSPVDDGGGTEDQHPHPHRRQHSTRRKSLMGVVCFLIVLAATTLLTILLVKSSSKNDNDDDGPQRHDIHFTVRGEAYSSALEMNSFLAREMGTANGINLSTVAIPHVTLYLTTFENSAGMRAALEDLIKNRRREMLSVCNAVRLEPPYASGNYAMAPVVVDSCLQRWSDSVVNATVAFIEKNQPYPSWLKFLPAAERHAKEESVRRYGSPNCFGSFQPHVSIGFFDNTTALAEVVSKIPARLLNKTFSARELGIGDVGVHGTVLRNKGKNWML